VAIINFKEPPMTTYAEQIYSCKKCGYLYHGYSLASTNSTTFQMNGSANYSKPKKFPPESCDKCLSKEFEIFMQSWTPLVFKAMYKKWERQLKKEAGI